MFTTGLLSISMAVFGLFLGESSSNISILASDLNTIIGFETFLHELKGFIPVVPVDLTFRADFGHFFLSGLTGDGVA